MSNWVIMKGTSNWRFHVLISERSIGTKGIGTTVHSLKLILEQGTPKSFLERQLLYLGILFKDWCDGTKNNLDLNGYSSDIILDLIPCF